ncbi:MAG: DNA-directed RNA polymerase subunit H [Methanomassiliicoccales archaeon]
MEEDIQLNVFNHDLVPAHYLLTEEEAKEVLAKLKVDKDKLPKIRKSDPCIRLLDALEQEAGRPAIKEGRVVKIVRRSPTSEIAIAYRLVIRG